MQAAAASDQAATHAGILGAPGDRLEGPPRAVDEVAPHMTAPKDHGPLDPDISQGQNRFGVSRPKRREALELAIQVAIGGADAHKRVDLQRFVGHGGGLLFLQPLHEKRPELRDRGWTNSQAGGHGVATSDSSNPSAWAA